MDIAKQPSSNLTGSDQCASCASSSVGSIRDAFAAVHSVFFLCIVLVHYPSLYLNPAMNKTDSAGTGAAAYPTNRSIDVVEYFHSRLVSHSGNQIPEKLCRGQKSGRGARIEDVKVHCGISQLFSGI